MTNSLNNKDIIIEFYREHGLWSRHQESQRAVVSNFMITISAALIGFVLFDKEVNRIDVPITILVSLIGMFGALFSYKYYERFNFHDSRINAYKCLLNEMLGSIELNDVETKADEMNKKRFSVLSKHGLYAFWIAFHSMIFISGILLTIMAWLG